MNSELYGGSDVTLTRNINYTRHYCYKTLQFEGVIPEE